MTEFDSTKILITGQLGLNANVKKNEKATPPSSSLVNGARPPVQDTVELSEGAKSESAQALWLERLLSVNQSALQAIGNSLASGNQLDEYEFDV